MTNPTASFLMGGAVSLVNNQPPNLLNILMAGFVKLRDVNHGGDKIVAGQVDISGTPDVPVRRRVRLHRKSDGFCVGETWSGIDGNYSFPGVADQLYYVIAFDHTGSYNAVVKDSITPIIP
jgi:hypothetical protein